jgi:general secretion pathway protein G
VIGKFLENQSRKSKIAVHRLKSEKGFSLLELMITMFILVILISVAMPTYQRSVQNARETVLRENLWQMRRSIDQYAADKGKLPQSIEDLVEGKYLREVPVDPITEKAEWKTVQGEDPNSSDGEQGLTDVKSMADGEDSDGKKYEDY